jgi:hypothetical protein
LSVSAKDVLTDDNETGLVLKENVMSDMDVIELNLDFLDIVR